MSIFDTIMLIVILIAAGFLIGLMSSYFGLLRFLKSIVIKYEIWPFQSKTIIQKVTSPEALFNLPNYNWKEYRYAYQFDQVQNLFENKVNELSSKMIYGTTFNDKENLKKEYEISLNHFLELLGGKELGDPKNVKLLDQKAISITSSSKLKRVLIQSRIKEIKVDAVIGTPTELSKPLPAIIALHGYTSSPDKVMGLNEEDYTHNFGKELLDKGYYVIAPFILNHGDRVSNIGAIGSLAGDTVWRIELIKVLSVLDYLQQTNIVDSSRIGIYGISGGGMLALSATAVDSRIQCAVCSGHLRDSIKTLIDYALGYNMYKRSNYNFRSDSYFVNAPFHLNFPSSTIAKMSFPTPIMFDNGRKDLVLKEYNDDEEFEKIKKFYSKYDFADRVVFNRHDGAHETDVISSINWIEKWV